jgi:DNA repair exonuclease SbcCD ATPase subunit
MEGAKESIKEGASSSMEGAKEAGSSLGSTVNSFRENIQKRFEDLNANVGQQVDNFRSQFVTSLEDMKNSHPDAASKLDELRESFNSRLEELRSALPSTSSLNLEELMHPFQSHVEEKDKSKGPAHLEHVADRLQRELDEIHRQVPAIAGLDAFMDHFHARLSDLQAALPPASEHLEQMREAMRNKMEELKRLHPSAKCITMEYVDYSPSSKQEGGESRHQKSEL